MTQQLISRRTELEKSRRLFAAQNDSANLQLCLEEMEEIDAELVQEVSDEPKVWTAQNDGVEWTTLATKDGLVYTSY